VRTRASTSGSAATVAAIGDLRDGRAGPVGGEAEERAQGPYQDVSVIFLHFPSLPDGNPAVPAPRAASF
jgi:hypothetical protein